MNILELENSFQNLSFQEETFNNIFHSKINIDKDIYSKNEVTQLLNEYTKELNKKFYYYLKIINGNCK